MHRFVYKQNNGLYLIQKETEDGYLWSNIADYISTNNLEIKEIKWYIWNEREEEYDIVQVDTIKDLEKYLY